MNSQTRHVLNDKKYDLHYASVDETFIETLGMKILEGRNFDPEKFADKNSVILNETEFRHLGLSKFTPDEPLIINETGKIIGIVKDYHIQFVRESIEANIFTLIEEDRFRSWIGVKIQEGQTENVRKYVKAKWEELYPGQNMNSFFLDERTDSLYVNERKLFQALIAASFIMILIAGIGIFALSRFSIDNKTKEIGIRKVVGVSIPNILIMLIKDFVRWILLANLIAWFIMTKWLQSFAYRTELNIWPFILSALIALFIALATISWQAVRAAMRNPVESLRYE